ncbi:MAG: AgmX/PglI C-terminal domain-containing protein [Deltaproteobacteria bacterium]|nr:AgmX/PglI C-terminal domain-containing protein [Deltaproteobacteria bacterium]
MSQWNWRRALGAPKTAEQQTETQCIEAAVYWNGTCVRQDQYDIVQDKPFQYQVGETPQCQVMVASEFIQCSEFVLLETMKDEVTVHIPAFCQGTVQQGDVSDRFKECDHLRTHNLALHGRLVCDIGPWTFIFCRILKEDVVVGGAGFSLIPNRWTYISVAFHAVFFLLIGMVPPQASGMNFDDQMQTNPMMKYMIDATEQPAVEDVNIEPEAVAEGNSGKAQAGSSGKAGDRTAPKNGGRMAVKGLVDTKRPTIGREELKKMASQSGILSMLNTPTITSPFGEGATIGRDPENVLGDLIGNQIGMSFGVGGMGPDGAGRGGGGNGEGTLGVGNIGTDSFGHNRFGNCVGALCGGGHAGLKGAKDIGGGRPITSRIITNPGDGDVLGSLSKDVIRRYIRQRISQIKFCYERELIANEGLSGRISIMFMISGNGSVIKSAVKESTIANANVESCIANVVRRITFPSPPDKGTVVVTYPFNLIQSGK